MKSLLLDANVLSELFRANPEVQARLRKVSRIVISPVVEGEIVGGFRAGSRTEKNLEIWSRFLSEPFVDRVPLGSESADRYARIWAQLRSKGTPIPSNDMWIAAQAGELGVELLSFDHHFQHVDGLVWTHLQGLTD
ncbi:type II toxin-antitoxin system VapC family toxin [bacterium]|nr:type II toxin-antitoxin system VapC family toxin [bacterium]